MSTSTSFADRVKEFVRLPPSELKEHPENWRLHGREQRNALRYVLGRIGIAGVSIAYRDPEWGLTLIDGHMRQSEVGQDIPTVILDVTREEARLLLLSMDSISQMADRDDARISQLVKDTYDPEGDYLVMVKNMLGSISQKRESVIDDANRLLDQKQAEKDEPRYPLAAELNEQYDYVVILCRTTREFNALCDHLDVQKQADYKSSQVGLGRVVLFDKVSDKLGVRA